MRGREGTDLGQAVCEDSNLQKLVSSVPILFRIFFSPSQDDTFMHLVLDIKV